MPQKKAAKQASAYTAHRERQRRRIMDAAWKLFDGRGIDRVTMAEITTVSGVQPSTMYQYFSNKDDIVWAIVDEVMREVTERAQLAMAGAPNALARLTAFLDFLADELVHHRVKVRFMAQFDAIYARDWPVERLLLLESQINPDGFQVFTDLVNDGIADGSFRRDLVPDLTMHAVINAVIGAQRRLASLGDKAEKEYGKPIDLLFREAVQVLLAGLRAPLTPAPPPARQQKSGKKPTRKRSL